jgi:hypothetical protein
MEWTPDECFMNHERERASALHYSIEFMDRD